MALVKWISISLVGIIVVPLAYAVMDIIAGENIPLAYKLLFIFLIPIILVTYAVSDISK